MDVNIRPIVTGLLSRIPGLFEWWDKRRPMGNTASSEYCRGIWRMHLKNYQEVTGIPMPQSVGELGPGATLGTCIAAIVDGVKEAIAFDAGNYANLGISINIYDELAGTASDRSDVESIRREIARAGVIGSETILKYVAPWQNLSACAPSSLDMVFSHSVMEHVVDPIAAYKACHYWLKPGGIMSHRIDHSSHGITQSWNGHYSIADILWRIIVGNRPHLLNRQTPSQHLSQIKAAGFEILSQSRFLLITPEGNPVEVSVLPDNEYSVKTSTILAIKVKQ